MSNDLGDSDITIFAGGYNCSHKVYAVDEQLADEAVKTLNKTYGKTVSERRNLQEKLANERIVAKRTS